MNFMIRNSDRAISQQPLTLDQIGRMAPSALATQPHESRSARYVYIPTVEIIQGMMRHGFQPFKATQSKCRIEGKSDFTKHMIRFRHMDLMQPGVSEVSPEVILINSHDGTSRYKLLAGIFRFVCENGMIVADSTTGSISIQHSGNILDNVIEGSYRIIEDSKKSLSAMNAWQQLQLTSGEQSAFAEAAHTVRFADTEGNVETPITAAQLLQPRRSDDAGNDLWRTFNRVQENAVKGGLRGRRAPQPGEWRGRRVSSRAVNGIDQDVKLNRALWQLAEKMAELKAQ